MANKIKYGLEKVHIMPLIEKEEMDPIIGTPKSLPGAVNLSLDAEGDSTTFRADNTAYYVANANNGYTGELEIAIVPDWFLEEYLGYKKDASGILVEDSMAQGNYFAMSFEFSGDEKATRHILYKVKASRMTLEAKTTEESVEAQTDTLPITVVPLNYNDVNIVKGKTTDDTPTSVYDNWYKNPSLPVMEQIEEGE